MIRFVIVLALCIITLVVRGDYEYPTLERAQELFASETLNSTNILSPHLNSEYREFMNSLSGLATVDREIEMETFLLSSITTLVVGVSTNAENSGVNSEVLYDRGMLYGQLACSLHNFATNTENCIMLAKYIGDVNIVEYPSDLVMQRGHQALITTNEALRAEYCEIRRRWNERRDGQMYVHIQNEAVKNFRKDILFVCNVTVRGTENYLSPEDYANFTNELIRLSHATPAEQNKLFFDPRKY